MVSPVHPANYRLYHSTTYVGGYSTTMYPPPICQILINPTIAREESIRVRGKVKSKRGKRRCKKYCNLYNCQGAKTRAQKGKILRCQNLPIVMFEQLICMAQEGFIKTYLP